MHYLKEWKGSGFGQTIARIQRFEIRAARNAFLKNKCQKKKKKCNIEFIQMNGV